MRIVDDVCSRGAFIMHPTLTNLKPILLIIVPQVMIGVANATDGLELCWMAVGLNPGDEVIVSSHTMLATASAIRVAGARLFQLILVLIPIDPAQIEPAITSRTVGIMPTQLNGRTCDMNRIMSIAQV